MDTLNNDHHGELPPSETTGLLGSPVAAQQNSTLYYIEPVIASVRAKGVAACTIADWCPHRLASRTKEIAFALIVLLKLRKSISNVQIASGDVWVQWSEAEWDSALTSELDGQIVHLWNEYVKDDRTEEEIEEVLWAEFPMSYQDRRILRGEFGVRLHM